MIVVGKSGFGKVCWNDNMGFYFGDVDMGTFFQLRDLVAMINLTTPCEILSLLCDILTSTCRLGRELELGLDDDGSESLFWPPPPLLPPTCESFWRSTV
jgi:hypothetical protein